MSTTILIPVLVAAGLLWATPAPAETLADLSDARATTVREAHPMTLTGTVGWPGGLGLEGAYNMIDRLALACHTSWLLEYRSELGCDMRAYALAGESWGLYGSVGGSIVNVQPLKVVLGPPPDPYSELLTRAGIGYEYRAYAGFTIGAEAGASLALVDTSQFGSERVTPWLSLRVGYSW